MLAKGLFLEVKTREEAAKITAQLACAARTDGILHHGSARIILSGGSSPKETYQIMSREALDWTRVSVGLVDERFVSGDHAKSNARFVSNTLLKRQAEKARFLPMVTAGNDLADDARVASERYKKLLPADFALMGMGLDGHTASWFPGSAGIETAMSTDGDADAPCVVPIHASRADGCSERLTLSLAAVGASRQAILLIFGEEKRQVLLQAIQGDAANAAKFPVRALIDHLGYHLVPIGFCDSGDVIRQTPVDKFQIVEVQSKRGLFKSLLGRWCRRKACDANLAS